jgi:lysophospholipase L1-like esterase
MIRSRFLFVAFIAFLLLSACGEGKRYNVLRPNDVILAFGNSLTRGTGAAENQSYPAILHELTRRKVINAGVPGEVTSEGLRRLPDVLDQHEPDLLILCHGGNDMLRRLDRQQTIANLGAMIEVAQSRRIPVILVSVPQLGLLLDSAPFYKELAEQYKIPVANDVVSDVLSDRALKSDAIHPNAAGYEKMAKGIATVMKEAGAL